MCILAFNSPNSIPGHPHGETKPMLSFILLSMENMGAPSRVLSTLRGRESEEDVEFCENLVEGVCYVVFAKASSLPKCQYRIDNAIGKIMQCRVINYKIYMEKVGRGGVEFIDLFLKKFNLHMMDFYFSSSLLLDLAPLSEFDSFFWYWGYIQSHTKIILDQLRNYQVKMDEEVYITSPEQICVVIRQMLSSIVFKVLAFSFFSL